MDRFPPSSFGISIERANKVECRFLLQCARMFPRSSYRYTLLIVGVLTILTSLSLLENWLQSYSHNKISIISLPSHEPKPAPRKLQAFWAEWADVLEKARPKTARIDFKGQASTDGSDLANGDRTPAESLLHLSDKDAESLKGSHKILVDELKKLNVEKVRGLFSGSGVVTVAGGRFLPPMITSIKMLRRSGSKLPVQVFLQSRGEYEAEVCEDFLPKLNAECYVIEDYLRKDAPFSIAHFQLKALAILLSSFESVVYLDSDCMPLHDPSNLLSAEPYLSTGLVTWPDYWKATEDPVFYRIAGLPAFPTGVPARATESGQLLVSKSKHITTLLLAAYYNVFGPGYYYPILSQGAIGEGDKETFLAAAVVLGNPFYRVRERVGTLGYHDEEGRFHGGVMVQHDPRDDYQAQQRKQPAASTAEAGNAAPQATVRPYFVHANVPKMNLGRLLDEPGLRTQNGERRRLWGAKEQNMKKFGIDLERVVWNEMVEPGCELRDVLRDWKGLDRVCDRAREHWNDVFLGNGRRRIKMRGEKV